MTSKTTAQPSGAAGSRPAAKEMPETGRRRVDEQNAPIGVFAADRGDRKK